MNKRPLKETKLNKPKKKLKQLLFSTKNGDEDGNKVIYVSSENIEQKNLEKCKDIKLHESVIKSYLRKYNQNLAIARHYLLQFQVDIEESRLIDKASLESEVEKERINTVFEERKKELFTKGSLKDIKNELFPKSIVLSVQKLFDIFESNRDMIIKLLCLEKNSLKFYPTSAKTYFEALTKRLESEKYESIKICKDSIQEVELFLYTHPDEIDQDKVLFVEEEADSENKMIIKGDGLIELI